MVRSTPSSCARKVSSSARSRKTAPGKSAVNFGFTTFFDPSFQVQISNFHCFVIVFCNELPEPVHDPVRLLQQTWNNDPNRTVAIVLSGLQHVDQVVPWFPVVPHEPENCGFSVVCTVLYDQDLVRSPPMILAATSRTPPASLLLSMPRNVVLKWEAMTMSHTYETVTPPTPPPGAIILFRVSVHLRKISCSVLNRPSSSASTSLLHSLTFKLAKTLPDSFPNHLTFPRSMHDASITLQSAGHCCA